MLAVHAITTAKPSQNKNLLLLAEFCRAAEREKKGLKSEKQSRAPELLSAAEKRY